MKLFILATMICLGSINVSAQEFITLRVNNKVIGKMKAPSSEPVVFEAERSRFKNVRTIGLEFIPAQANPYKRTIEITDGEEKQLLLIEESGKKGGNYMITSPVMIRSLQKEKSLNVYALLNPKNKMMGMPSRRNLLVEVHMH